LATAGVSEEALVAGEAVADSVEGLAAETEAVSHLVAADGVEASAITDLVGSMDLRAAVSAVDLVGLRPVSETDPATALGLQAEEAVVGIVAGEESSASTKEGMRARRNEEGTDGDEDGCGSTVCMLSGALSAFPLPVGLVHRWFFCALVAEGCGEESGLVAHCTVVG